MALNNGLNDPTTNAGDIIYRDSTGKTTKLPVGTDKEVLKINGTNPEWQTEGDENSVKLTGDQTIAGVKTFTSSPVVPTPTTNFQAATKKYVDDNATAGYVDITTAQSIGGVKTFTSSPVVPTPTTNFQAATKKYVDDNATAGYEAPLGEVKMFALSMTGAVTKANLQTNNWAICDGTTPATQGISTPTITTTPDLQHSFIRMSNDESSGTTGGSDEHNHQTWSDAGSNGLGFNSGTDRAYDTDGILQTTTYAPANKWSANESTLPTYYEVAYFIKVK